MRAENAPKNSFKPFAALNIDEPNFTIDLLQIDEYVDSSNKSFIYKGAFGEVVTGICVEI